MNKLKELENKTQVLEATLQEVMAKLSTLKGELGVKNLEKSKYVDQKYYTDAKDYIGIMIPTPVLFTWEQAENSKKIADAIPVYFESSWMEIVLKGMLNLDLNEYLESNHKSIADIYDEETFCIFEKLLNRAKDDGVDVMANITGYERHFKCPSSRNSNEGEGVIVHLKDDYKNVVKFINYKYPDDGPDDDIAYEIKDFRKLLKPNSNMFEDLDDLVVERVLDIMRATLDLLQNDTLFAKGISPLVFKELKQDEKFLKYLWTKFSEEEKDYLRSCATVNESYSAFEINFANLEYLDDIMDVLSGVFEERFHYKKAIDWQNKFELAYKILEFYNKNIEDKDIFVYKTILSEEKIDVLVDTFINMEKKSKALYVYQGLYGKEDINKPCITKDDKVCKYLLKDEITQLVKNTINEVFQNNFYN